MRQHNPKSCANLPITPWKLTKHIMATEGNTVVSNEIRNPAKICFQRSHISVGKKKPNGPLCVDNHSDLKALNSHTIKSMAVLHFGNGLENVKSFNKIFLVQGHCNTSANESANKLLRLGSVSIDL